MSTDFAPLEIPPGVVAHATKRMRSSNWSEVNAVRWVEGRLAPIGGQQVLSYTTPLASRCRAIHSWYDLAGEYRVAYLCETNVYLDYAGTLTEITPAGGIAAPTSAGDGYGLGQYGMGPYGQPPRPGASIAAILNVIPDMWTIENYGALLLVMASADGRLLQWDPAGGNVNDVQTLSMNGSPTGGTFTLTFKGTPTTALNWNAAASDVQSALAATIGAGIACTGGPLPASPITITFGGSLGNAPQPDILIGANSLTGGTGPAPVMAHTTMGSSVLLTRVPNSPKGRCFVVTQDRFVQIFGMIGDDGSGSARRWGWCNQEDITNWNFASVTSQAGFFDIEPASPIITAISGRSGWTLFFTSQKAYLAQFLGLPFVYNYQELADDCTPWSPASISTTSSLIVWMSQQGAFSFDGSSVTPVECQIRPWIDGNADPSATRWQAAACHLGQFNEFWWFFPAVGQPNNTLAAIYNYKEGWWSMAHMPRSAGITSSYTAYPIFADGTTLYRHESGNVFNGCDLPWADTFDLNLSSGGKLTTVKQMLVNLEGDPSMQHAIRYQLYYKNSRMSSAPESKTPLIAVRSDGYVDFRTTGRDIRLRFQVIGGNMKVANFTLGQHLVDIVQRGDR